MPILFGISCVVSAAFARRSRDPDAFGMALLLCLYWLVANVAQHYDALIVLPAIDWMLGVMALTVWWGRRARWVAYLVHCILTRLVLHVLDFLTGHAFFISYVHALNATYAVMIALVAFPGGWHGNRVFDSLLRRLHGVRRVLSAAPKAGLK